MYLIILVISINQSIWIFLSDCETMKTSNWIIHYLHKMSFEKCSYLYRSVYGFYSIVHVIPTINCDAFNIHVYVKVHLYIYSPKEETQHPTFYSRYEFSKKFALLRHENMIML